MDSAAASSVSLTSTLVNEAVDPLQSPQSPQSPISSQGTIPGVEEDSAAHGNDNDNDVSDEELLEGQSRERHADHWDITTDVRNPWCDELDVYSADWCTYRVRKDEESLANDKLYQNESTQQWMSEVSRLNRAWIEKFRIPAGRNWVECSIPLFRGSNGWEYQVRISGGRPPLPEKRCPSVSGDPILHSSTLFQLTSGAKIEHSVAFKFPKLCMTLGILTVRSDARSDYFPAGKIVTEDTDYYVFVDLRHQDMPVWLLAPRAQLEGRLNNPFYDPEYPIRHLPMFDGLLEQEGGGAGFDAGCIVSSVRRLGVRLSDDDSVSAFRDACELLRKTRAVIEPVALLLSEQKENELLAGDMWRD